MKWTRPAVSVRAAAGDGKKFFLGIIPRSGLTEKSVYDIYNGQGG